MLFANLLLNKSDYLTFQPHCKNNPKAVKYGPGSTLLALIKPYGTLAGPGGIEPPPEVLETSVLPLYEGPLLKTVANVANYNTFY